jgi:uncharacterized protein (TIGR02246 family)
MSTREINAGNRAFVDAAVRHDLDAIASLFTVDAIALPPDGEVTKGRDAIRQLWKSAIDGGLSGVKIKSTKIQVVGDMAIDIGHATLSMAPAGAAATDTDVKDMAFWKKVRGHWRIYRDMWNARSPA